MATAATLNPAEAEKLEKLKAATAALNQIRFLLLSLFLFV